MRNFGVSSRPTDGGIQQGGSHMRDAILPRNSNSVAATPSRRFNSGGESCQLSIQTGEIASGCLFFGLLIAPWIIVFAIAFIYQALVP